MGSAWQLWDNLWVTARQHALVMTGISLGTLTKVVCLDGLWADLQLSVAPVIPFRPLQLIIVPNKRTCLVVRARQVTAVPGRGNRSHGEFNADGAFPGSQVVVGFIQPHEVAHLQKLSRGNNGHEV